MIRPRRLLSWNCRVGRPAPIVIAGLWFFIRTRRPHVIVLLEATRLTSDLRKVFGKGWHVYRRRSDVVVLVRRDVDRPNVSVIGHEESWRGPHEGIEHRGRKFLQLDWPGLSLLAIHRVPGGPSGGVSPRLSGANRGAWLAENQLLADALGVDSRPVVIVGDQNARPVEVHPFMARHNLHPIITGAKVDWAMVRGITGRGKRLGRRGSDHPACLYVLTKPKEKKP